MPKLKDRYPRQNRKTSKKKTSNKQATLKVTAFGSYAPNPAAESFVGVCYFMYGRQALYHQECLRRNLFPRIRGAFYDHGFCPVDASKVLKLVIGFSSERSMQFKGPVFPWGNADGSTTDFRGLFFVQDRSMVDQLINIIFSMKDSVAHNQIAVPLVSRIQSAEYSEDTGFRKAVIMYNAGSPDDCLCVTIEGVRADPNTFTFEHTRTWIENRYSRCSAAETPPAMSSD